MIKKMIGASCIMLSAANLWAGEPSGIQTNTGGSIHGIQLSITLSNSVIAIGSTFSVSVTIQNSSTNVVKMVETGMSDDFVIILASSSGKDYRLTPDTSKWPHTFRYITKINPGENHTWKIPEAVPKDIKNGSYTLKASTAHVGFEIISNSLKIDVNGGSQ